MSDIQTSENILKFVKDSDGDNVFIFSPFFPFNNILVKNLFLNLNIPDYQFIFSSIIFNKSLKIDLYSYNNFLTLYTKVIKLLYPKKINLVCFGIFTNLFIELANLFKDKIKSIVFFEPDLSDNIFSKLFDFKKSPVLKNKYIIDCFFEKPNGHKNVNKHYLNKIKLEYLKFYFQSIKKINKNYHLKDLIDFVPDSIPNNIFNDRLLNRIAKKKDRMFVSKYYLQERSNYILQNLKLNENDRLKLKQILREQNLLVKITIFWKKMANESWPLAQIFEDYKVPVNLMNHNIYKSFLDVDQDLITLLKKFYKKHV